VANQKLNTPGIASQGLAFCGFTVAFLPDPNVCEQSEKLQNHFRERSFDARGFTPFSLGLLLVLTVLTLKTL